MKILVLALSGIGDALMFTPSLQLIRKHFPDAVVDAVVMFEGVKDMYDRTGLVNDVYYFDFIKEGVKNSLGFMRGLRGNYEYSISPYPSNRKEYNVINYMTGAKRRAGTRYLRRDRQNLGFLNNVRITESDERHFIEENVMLIEKLLQFKADKIPPLLFPLSREDEEFADTWLAGKNIGEENTLYGFHAGCAVFKNMIKKRWEPEKFGELGRKLLEDKSAHIIIFGGPDEDDLKKKIADIVDSERAHTADAITLPQSAALIKRCDVFITNDSGLMHTAAAMKTKTAAIYGPTSVEYTYPWHTNHRTIRTGIECSPCFIMSPKHLKCYRTDTEYKCIKEITVDMVLDAVRELK